ncbi:hypothetical protein [uncultured Devosia sp.]|uniref:hypothetical protein n=1 Tax=uncultured Devosia sp. TaxID=211434 RepID=UPI0035C9FF6A
MAIHFRRLETGERLPMDRPTNVFVQAKELSERRQRTALSKAERIAQIDFARTDENGIAPFPRPFAWMALQGIDSIDYGARRL